MSDLYFSERELGPKPRIENEIGANVWGGLASHINAMADQGYFGDSFPEMCGDNDGVIGTDKSAMALVVLAEFPNTTFPFDVSETPPTLTILDLLEFCHEHIAKPIQGYYHSFYRLHHLSFDVEEGQSEFRAIVNRLFARNGIAFELQGNGQIVRIAPPVVGDYLRNAVFRTGDPHLDSMLETARSKYLDPSLQIRLEALEKLWDAWERIKTLEHPGNKKRSIGILLDKVSHESNMRERLDREAVELTEIGNAFMIRHTETDKIPITSSAHVDYLFHRMFALVYLLLGDRVGQKIDNVSQDAHVERTVEQELPF